MPGVSNNDSAEGCVGQDGQHDDLELADEEVIDQDHRGFELLLGHVCFLPLFNPTHDIRAESVPHRKE